MIDRDGDALADAVTSLDNVHGVFCDVSDPRAVQGMVDEVIRHFGGIDALVNNAGVADFGPIEDTTFKRWRSVIESADSGRPVRVSAE